MENKKLEDHKIDEGELENVAGGYNTIKVPFRGSILMLNQEEYNTVKQANYINHLKDGSRYIKKSDYEKIQDLLKKSDKTNEANSHDDFDNLDFNYQFLAVK